MIILRFVEFSSGSYKFYISTRYINKDFNYLVDEIKKAFGIDILNIIYKSKTIDSNSQFEDGDTIVIIYNGIIDIDEYNGKFISFEKLNEPIDQLIKRIKNAEFSFHKIQAQWEINLKKRHFPNVKRELTVLIVAHGSDTSELLPNIHNTRKKINMASLTQYGAKTFMSNNDIESIKDTFLIEHDKSDCELIKSFLINYRKNLKKWLWTDEMIFNTNKEFLFEMIENGRSPMMYTPILEHKYYFNDTGINEPGIFLLNYKNPDMELTELTELIGMNLIESGEHPLQSQISEFIRRNVSIYSSHIFLSEIISFLEPLADRINIIDISCRSLDIEIDELNHRLTQKQVSEMETSGTESEIPSYFYPSHLQSLLENQLFGKRKSKKQKKYIK